MQNNSRWSIIRVTVGTALPCCVQGVVSRTLLHPQAKIHGCSSPLYKMHSVCTLSLQLCPTLCDPMDCSPTDSSVLGSSSGKTPGMGCYALLQGIFPTQESNLCLSYVSCLGPHSFVLWTLSHFLVLLLIFASINGHCLQQSLLQCSHSNFLFPPLSLIKTSWRYLGFIIIIFLSHRLRFFFLISQTEYVPLKYKAIKEIWK